MGSAAKGRFALFAVASALAAFGDRGHHAVVFLGRQINILIAALSSGSLLLPLSDQTNWQVLQYSRLPPHHIRFSKTGLEMRVEGSAMPLIYPLSAPMRVTGIRVKGRIEGTLRVPPERQGQEKFDDYAFRIGLVEPGERTLNFVQGRLAAAWVRKLFDLAPSGGGGSIRSAI